MKIAILACPEVPVPPKGYGGAQRIVDIMVTQLVKRDHEIDLYAGPGSTSPATNLCLIKDKHMTSEKQLFGELIENYHKYDCVIDHSANHLAGLYFSKKVLSIMGGDPFFKYNLEEVKNKVFKSPEFAVYCGYLDHPILRNPVCNEPEKIHLGTGNGGYALYVGVIHPMKGLHIAAEACYKLKIPFKIAGIFRTETKRYLRALQKVFNNVEYVGELTDKGRTEIFNNATVFLHPTRVCDCEPTSPKEAMLHGTPVVATPLGGINSTIDVGVSGMFAVTVDDFVKTIPEAIKLDRSLVRENILKKININNYTNALEALCVKVKDGLIW